MAMALAAPDAIVKWRAMLGPTKVYRGKWEQSQPVGLRARYGIGDTRNGLHGSGEQRAARALPVTQCADRGASAQTPRLLHSASWTSSSLVGIRSGGWRGRMRAQGAWAVEE